MNSCQATWEDEENNRRVELVVNYRLDAKRVEINDVTPTRVNFLCPTSGNHAALDRRLDRTAAAACSNRQIARVRPAARCRKKSPKANWSKSSVSRKVPWQGHACHCRPN